MFGFFTSMKEKHIFLFPIKYLLVYEQDLNKLYYLSLVHYMIQLLLCSRMVTLKISQEKATTDIFVCLSMLHIQADSETNGYNT